jgi:hypothetical protein
MYLFTIEIVNTITHEVGRVQLLSKRTKFIHVGWYPSHKRKRQHLVDHIKFLATARPIAKRFGVVCIWVYNCISKFMH